VSGDAPARDPRSADDEAVARVREFLLARGVPARDIDRAAADDVLDLLVADRLLVPAERHYTESEVTERTGIPIDLTRRFWRALGFADVAPEDRVFTDLDLEALLTLRSMIELGAIEIDAAVQLARVIGSSMARIAEAEVSPAVRGLVSASGSGTSVEAAERLSRMADRSLPAMARLLEYVWRRHVQAAVRRAMLLRSRDSSGALPVLAVGFADMVGFTMLSQQLGEDELAAVVSRFEEVAHDTVTSGGGRVVKMIGDEAMFVAESVVDAARIGLALAEAYADDELLSDVRVALAVGPVLVQDGDFFGPVVNLASRMVTMAEPGTVLMSEQSHDALVRQPESAEFAFRALGARQVKDLGRVQLFALHRPGSEPMAPDRRVGRRWERLSDVLRDLDDLRERGERLIAGARQAGDEAVTRSASRPGPGSGAGRVEGGDAERTELE